MGVERTAIPTMAKTRLEQDGNWRDGAKGGIKKTIHSITFFLRELPWL